MQYQQPVHTGTPEEIAEKLMHEARDVLQNGGLRMHAQDREIARITRQLEDLGVDLLDGDGDDDGYLLGIRTHNQDCTLGGIGTCECKPDYRVRYREPSKPTVAPNLQQIRLVVRLRSSAIIAVVNSSTNTVRSATVISDPVKSTIDLCVDLSQEYLEITQNE